MALRDLANRFDPRNGCFWPAPKFPSPHNILFLLTHFRTTGSALSLQMARLTLTRMRQGGIWDHVGYGFHRDRKSTRLNSSHVAISYAVFCLKKKSAMQLRHKQYT